LFVSNGGTILAARVSSHGQHDWNYWRVHDDNQPHVFYQPYAVFSPDASRYVTWQSAPGRYRIGIWDLKTGAEVASHYVGGIIDWARFKPTISPRGNMIATATLTSTPDTMGTLVRQVGFNWPLPTEPDFRSVTLISADTGQLTATVRGDADFARWSRDGSLLATVDQDERTIRIWDVPPRQSLAWLAVGAALLALPIALVAWRRTRKLRAA
jgi:WD40 repeat protein